MDEILAQPPAGVAKLLQQQAALAAFGTYAFRQTDLQMILSEAARICAASLDVPFCKVCRYRAIENDLLVVAGCGWEPNVVGHVISSADQTTPQGRAYVTNAPVIIQNVQESNDLILPAFYAQHGIISTIDVVTKGLDGPAYGILEVDSPVETIYGENDVTFLTGFANVLAEAVATQTRMATLRLFAHELQHRTRNNLHQVQVMLDTYADTVSGDEAKKNIEAITLQLMTMTEMYDHLLGAGLGGGLDFGSYLSTLCSHLVATHGNLTPNVNLVCTTESVQLGLNAVTTIGLAIAELVTNSYLHAYPAGRSGTINVTLSRSQSGREATVTIKDNGVGFESDAGSKRHGLGLVRRLVETVDGTIIRASDHHLGTEWTMTFPALANPLTAPTAPQS